jgi:NADH-ubiquinone oxidoreductase chain 5
MGMPLLILATLSIFFGYIARDTFVGMGTSFLANSLFIHPNHISYIEAEFALPYIYKFLPLIGGIFGGLIASIIYQNITPLSLLTKIILRKPFINIHRFLSRKYNFDDIYSYFLQFSLKFGYITNKVFDRGLLEIVGPYGLVKVIKNTSTKLTYLDSGFIPSYALYMFIGLISLLSLIYFEINSKLLLLFL